VLSDTAAHSLTHSPRSSHCLSLSPQANAALEFFTDLMLEQYMDGCEVDCDIVLSNGKVVYANVVDNGPTQEPWFQVRRARRPRFLSWAAAPRPPRPLATGRRRTARRGQAAADLMPGALWQRAGRAAAGGPQGGRAAGPARH
jgi:hypothetical protein